MESRIDALAKALAESGSRREALKRFAGAAAAAALGVVGISCSPDDLVGPNGRATRPLFAPGRCKKNNHKCRENDECCNGLCDPLTGVCACAAGTTICPVSGQCVPVCGTFEVLNPETCRCECGPASQQCGTTCCAPGLSCCGGSCVNFSTDVNHCGNCTTVCNTFPGADEFNEVCTNGTCGCPSGQQACSSPGFAQTFCCPPGRVCLPGGGCSF